MAMAWALVGVAVVAALGMTAIGIALVVTRRPKPAPACQRKHVENCTRPHLDELPKLQRQPRTHTAGPPATRVLWQHTPEMSAQTQPIKRVEVMT